MTDENQHNAAAQPNPLLELKAMEEVHTALAKLTVDGQQRVVAWAVSALQLPLATPQATNAHQSRPAHVPLPAQQDAPSGGGDVAAGPGSYATFADLFSAASPTTNQEKALVGGYWLQVCQGIESFASMAINNELKNLGEGVENITSAFDGLKDTKPQLALQVRKEGKSQQARKKYKLTVAGIRAVDRMIRGEGADG
jgi:hypothetical protein